jgi:hypothetical protein
MSHQELTFTASKNESPAFYSLIKTFIGFLRRELYSNKMLTYDIVSEWRFSLFCFKLHSYSCFSGCRAVELLVIL